MTLLSVTLAGRQHPLQFNVEGNEYRALLDLVRTGKTRTVTFAAQEFPSDTRLVVTLQRDAIQALVVEV